MCAPEVLVIKPRPHLMLVEGTKVAMFVYCSLSILGGLMCSETQIACQPLMDDWWLPALFLNHRVHVTICDPFRLQQFLTPSYQGICFTSMLGYNANPAL